MGNFSCIYAKQSDGQEMILFEGNNPLPFFWLMLMSREDIELYREKLSAIPKDKADKTDTGIGLDKIKAITRATHRRDYVKQFFTTYLSLFDDWIYYLQGCDFSDMKIYIDLYNARSYYSDLDSFIESLHKAIICFDEMEEAWYEDTVASICGYESQNKNKKRFIDRSKVFQALKQKDTYGRFDKSIHLRRQKSTGKRILRIVLAILVIALVVAGGMYFLLESGLIFN
jgi:hypothetical protein